MSETGIVFNIQRFSVHDGPGIRTTVFFKGCSLRCFWCHNPEGIHPRPEIQFHPSRCIGCGACLQACPQGAHESQGGAHVFHRERCTACGRCTETCYAGALEMTGRRMAAEQVVAEVLRDRAFYETSSGGVTLSGGEPLLQPAFAQAILEHCRAEGLHTAIETAANCPWSDLAALLPLTGLIMMDIKHTNPAKHRAATGVSNERILANAQQLAQSGKPLIFRLPIVPAVNDTPAEVEAIAALVRQLAALRPAGAEPPSLELLPFHRLAADKYHSLGLDYRAANLDRPGAETMRRLAEVARTCGIIVKGA